ncbi:MAG: DUF465 domain-containing protein [Pseudomonadota bacterium]
MQFEDIDESGLRKRLSELKLEHRDLDDVIAAFSSEPGFNQIQLRRLKKRKLQLKDLIARIESKLIPDLNA